jgi:hypothetical protein
MKMIYLIFISLIALAKSEGYYCPYDSIGYDGINDLLYDYYESKDNYWIRMNRTGWETRESYCNAKGNLNIHSDAGKAKCEDSQGTCIWDGTSCNVNVLKKPDCFKLCNTIVNNGGLSCLGNCPNGYSSRDTLYNLCNKKSESRKEVQHNKNKRRKKLNKTIC